MNVVSAVGDEALQHLHAHIDFTRELHLRDILSILIALRDQLQSHADEQGKYLTFPRFDPGAAIAMKVPLGSSLPAKGKDEMMNLRQLLRLYSIVGFSQPIKMIKKRLLGFKII